MPKRVLLDECLPRHLKRSLAGHEVALAVGKYDVFVTVDRNLTFQRNLEKLQIAIVVLVARGNRLVDLMPLVPALERAVETIGPGQIVRLGV